MNKTVLIAFSVFLIWGISGCTGSKFIVKKNPDNTDQGFRYFSPKPYLLVSVTEGKFEGKIVYLPNLNEEYSVNVEDGNSGTFNGSLSFENGWNLTSANQQYDIKAGETIDALVGAVGAIGGFAALGKGPKPGQVKQSFLLFEIDLKGRKLIPFKGTIAVEIPEVESQSIQEENPNETEPTTTPEKK